MHGVWADGDMLYSASEDCLIVFWDATTGRCPYALHPTPYTPHPTPHTLHPTPYTLHPTPYTLHPTPYTPLHPPISQPLSPTPHTEWQGQGRELTALFVLFFFRCKDGR